MYQLGSSFSRVDTEYGVVLLDEVKGEYLNLNPTGTIVLEAMLASGAASDAVAALIAEFSVEPEVAAEDVADLLNDLISSGVLVPITQSV